MVPSFKVKGWLVPDRARLGRGRVRQFGYGQVKQVFSSGNGQRTSLLGQGMTPVPRRRSRQLREPAAARRLSGAQPWLGGKSPALAMSQR